MAINNPYVPGDPFSYDLKWIIRKIKELITSTENIDEHIEEYIEEYIDHLQIPTDYINVMEPRHGLEGVKGDGVTDDTNALKAIIAYCEANRAPLYIPQFCNVLITDDIKMMDMPNLILQGTISGDPALTVQISYDAQTTDAITWDIGVVDGPVLRMMGAKNAFIRVQKASELKLYADGDIPKYYSLAYNTFMLGNVQKLSIEGASGGWINENVFINGRIVTLIMDGDYSHNNNIFYRPTFENSSIDIYYGSNNYFYDVRLEGTHTIHFHDNATGNVMTRTWFSLIGTVVATTISYTDDNGSNVIIPATAGMNNYSLLEINKDSYGLDRSKFAKKTNGLSIIGTYEYIAHSGLVPVDKGALIYIDTDVNLWRICIELYDENRNLITTEPSTSPLYGGSLTWDNVNKFYASGSNTGNVWRGAQRYKYGTDTGVAYVKFMIRGGNLTGDFTRLNIWLLTSKTRFENGQMRLQYNYDVSNAAPSSGTYAVGDIVFSKAPTPGGFIGWVCTTAGSPGTWKTFGAISS